MDAQLVGYLEDGARRLAACGEKNEKDRIRNDMFVKMEPFIDLWLKRTLNYRQEFMTNQERLSLCWDCFEFCLRHYHLERNIPLANHFYGYTRFFLLSYFADKKKAAGRVGPSSAIDDGNRDNPNTFYEQIDDLKQFRNALPEDYQSIFDDAILSMTGSPIDKIPYRKSYAYGYYKYCEAKKIFKIVIDFLLRR